MVKRREKHLFEGSRGQPTEEQIENFASAAESGSKAVKMELDPNANRDYKAIRVPFNEFEYRTLEEVAKKTGRTKLNAIRWAVLQLSDAKK